MKKMHDGGSLPELIPESIAGDRRIMNAARSIGKMIDELVLNSDIPSLIVRMNSLSSAQLDHLALMFDISTWRDSWPVEMKRSVIKTIIRIKSRVGTRYAVREALSSLGASVTLREWWQTNPKGDPHTFSVTATLSRYKGVLDSDLQEDVMSLLDEAKPARSTYTFTLVASKSGGINFVGASRSAVVKRLKNF